jgi:hypothetical protein
MLRSLSLALKIRRPRRHQAPSGHRLEPMPRIRWYS